MTIYTDLNDAPAKHYGLVLMDPAWRFKTYAPPKEGQRGRRDAERHYPTMTLDQMKALPVRRVMAANSLCIMWTSWPHLPKALDLMAHYGFKYTSSFVVWMKLKGSFPPTRAFISVDAVHSDLHWGPGYTTRKNTEFALLGRRGSPKRIGKNIHEVIVAPVREHSRKPDQVYGLIERYAAGPYLEMNARTEHPGWDAWGNEVGKFTIETERPPRIVKPTDPDWDSPEAQARLFGAAE